MKSLAYGNGVPAGNVAPALVLYFGIASFQRQRLAAELPPVRFDQDAVSQALLNLLDNAAKY